MLKSVFWDIENYIIQTQDALIVKVKFGFFKKERKKVMKNVFITITGVKNYFGMKPFRVGKIFRIVKEDDNDYDEEAIRAELPAIDTIGYVANSTSTVYAGTVSAGRLYDKIDDYAYAQTMFITHSSVIALVLSPEEVEGDKDTPPVKEKESGNSKPKTKAKIGF